MELRNEQWRAARQLLESGSYTCVLRRDDTIHTATERGVKPLVRWLTEGTDLWAFWAADKVVGRATAYLYCLLGVQGVYAQVMSRPAAQVLEAHGIEAAWDSLVENIINRQGTGICPFEAAVLDITDPETALTAIREQMTRMQITL